MKRPAVFFDRDNTLIVSDGYLGDPAKVVLVEGAADAVAKARQYGFKVLTFSNQSGVARGMFDEAAVQAVNARMDELLQAANPGAKIVAHEYCPSHPEATVDKYREDSPRRKPRPGMLLDAAETHKLDLSRSWVIGDAPRDIEAGKAAGCRTILFKDPKLPASPAADAPTDVQPDFTVASLKEAVDLIGKEAFKPTNGRPVVIKKIVKASAAPPSTGSVPPQPPQSAGDDPPIAPMEHPRAIAVADDDPELPELPRPASTRAARAAESDGSTEVDAAALPRGNKQVQQLLLQILLELRRQRGTGREFSIPRLLAVLVQIVVLALLAAAFLNRASGSASLTVQFAIALQALTIALLLIEKGR